MVNFIYRNKRKNKRTLRLKGGKLGDFEVKHKSIRGSIIHFFFWWGDFVFGIFVVHQQGYCRRFFCEGPLKPPTSDRSFQLFPVVFISVSRFDTTTLFTLLIRNDGFHQQFEKRTLSQLVLSSL